MHYGIDVGGTKIEFAVFDRSFSRIHTHRINTPTDSYSEFVDANRALIQSADDEYGDHCTVGLGLAGIVDQNGKSFSTNVPCLNGHHVQADLSLAIDRNVRCINDVRAFALSEARGGAAEGSPTMVGVILGTGAASGFCRNGVPRLGADGVAGEWGHIPIPAIVVAEHRLPFFDCTCGKHGCIETYVSGPGLANLARHYMGEEVRSADCIARMRKGEVSAVRAFEVWVDCIAHVISQLVLHNNPHVIVIGGGMSKVEELYTLLPDAVAALLLYGVSPPPIRRAVFGDDSGVRGAAIVGSVV